MAATTADLETLYTKITDETSVRFDEGAANLGKITAELKETIEGLKLEMVNLESRLRNEPGHEMDRRIEIAIKAKEASTKNNLLSDPRNKGMEHFSGNKSEDTAKFKVWRAKA